MHKREFPDTEAQAKCKDANWAWLEGVNLGLVDNTHFFLISEDDDARARWSNKRMATNFRSANRKISGGPEIFLSDLTGSINGPLVRKFQECKSRVLFRAGRRQSGPSCLFLPAPPFLMSETPL